MDIRAYVKERTAGSGDLRAKTLVRLSMEEITGDEADIICGNYDLDTLEAVLDKVSSADDFLQVYSLLVNLFHDGCHIYLRLLMDYPGGTSVLMDRVASIMARLRDTECPLTEMQEMVYAEEEAQKQAQADMFKKLFGDSPPADA